VDAVRTYLKRSGVGQHVIDGGLEHLLDTWATVASAVERRDEWMWEEWMNDVDSRQILQDVLDHVPTSASALPQIKDADTRFLVNAVETDECQWGAENASRHGWTAEKNWWYWRRPPTPYL